MTDHFSDRRTPRLGLGTLPASEVISGKIQDVAADAIVVNLFAGVAAPTGATGAVDAAMGAPSPA